MRFDDPYENDIVMMVERMNDSFVVVIDEVVDTLITDAVVAARILNVTLVVPNLDKRSFWKDASSFSEIFDVDWFISHLSRDVKIIRELPHKGGKKWSPYSTRVPRKCNERCYHIRVLPLFSKRRAVQLRKFNYRLANKLETDFQKLRCRVNYHALRFIDPIIKMGQTLVNRMKKMGEHFIAMHLSQPNEEDGRTLYCAALEETSMLSPTEHVKIHPKIPDKLAQ
nr:GDP-fucose protein O-fucosyltransferase [Tanacetum cinerariifolium]